MKLDAARTGKMIVHDRLNKVLRAAGLELNKRIVEKTPVDTGRARANFNAAQEEDGTTDVEATESDVGAKLAANAGEIAGIDFAKGEDLYIANGLPYIPVLEAGSSTQAPAGMIEVSVLEMKPIVEKLADAEGRKDRGQ